MEIENMQAEIAEETADTEVTTPELLDAFDDGWDSDGIPSGLEDVDTEAEEADSEEAEANQQEAGSADASDVEKAPETKQEAETKPENQRITLKHYTGDREASLDETVVLAQKGIDYDIKVPKLNAKIADYEEFLKEIAAPNNYSIEQLIDTTRARLYQEEQKRLGNEISEADSLLKVQADRANRLKDVAAQQENAAKQQQEEASKKQQESLQRFIALYPDVKAVDIPNEVWQKEAEIGDLATAYTMYRNKQLEAEIAAIKTNEKNAKRSTGSQRNTGAAKTVSAFDEGWDSID